MSTARFEPTIPASERPQTHALEGAATGIGKIIRCNTIKYLITSQENSIYTDSPFFSKIISNVNSLGVLHCKKWYISFLFSDFYFEYISHFYKHVTCSTQFITPHLFFMIIWYKTLHYAYILHSLVNYYAFDIPLSTFEHSRLTEGIVAKQFL
jgi:hypothetical protein